MGCCCLLVCFNFCHSSGYEWYLIVGIIYLSLITNDFEYILCACRPFVYLLMYLFKSSAHFNKWLVQNMSGFETPLLRAIQVSMSAHLVKVIIFTTSTKRQHDLPPRNFTISSQPRFCLLQLLQCPLSSTTQQVPFQNFLIVPSAGTFPPNIPTCLLTHFL